MSKFVHFIYPLLWWTSGWRS